MTKSEWFDFKKRWQTPVTIKKLSDIDIGRIAAFIDGEGCIGLIKTVHPNNQYDLYTPHIEVINTNKYLCNWLVKITGIGCSRSKGNRRNTKHKMAYIWRLAVDEMIPLLTIIGPHLLLKNRQAVLLIDYLKLPRKCGGYNRFIPDEVVQQREIIYQELKELNQRGPQEAERAL